MVCPQVVRLDPQAGGVHYPGTTDSHIHKSSASQMQRMREHRVLVHHGDWRQGRRCGVLGDSAVLGASWIDLFDVNIKSTQFNYSNLI